MQRRQDAKTQKGSDFPDLGVLELKLGPDRIVE